MTNSPTPYDAATIVVLRDVKSGPPEIYMVKRNVNSSFMGGAYVFPGGRLDPEDFLEETLACVFELTAKEASSQLGETNPAKSLGLYVAALRETFEEAGLLLGREKSGSLFATSKERLAMLKSSRQKLLAKEIFFHSWLQKENLLLDANQLVYLSRWITPEAEPKRFDTRFFIAPAPAGQIAEYDQSETTDGIWLSAKEVLQRHEKKEIFLAPPTFRTLENLLPFQKTAEAIDTVKKNQTPVIMPALRFGQDGEVIILLNGDKEHPASGSGPYLEGPSRIILQDGRWWSRS